MIGCMGGDIQENVNKSSLIDELLVALILTSFTIQTCPLVLG